MRFFKGELIKKKKFKSGELYEVLIVHRDGTYTISKRSSFDYHKRLSQEDLIKEFDSCGV